MDEILTGYDVNEPTWFYLSFLLITAVFFKFGRIWSLRNIDLVLLLLISPGLLILQRGDDIGDSALEGLRVRVDVLHHGHATRAHVL